MRTAHNVGYVKYVQVDQGGGMIVTGRARVGV